MTKPLIDETHDPARMNCVSSASGHSEYPVQKLLLGILSREESPCRPGVTIGHKILDLRGVTRGGTAAQVVRVGTSAAHRGSCQRDFEVDGQRAVGLVMLGYSQAWRSRADQSSIGFGACGAILLPAPAV